MNAREASDLARRDAEDSQERDFALSRRRFTNLPTWASDAIDSYEAKKASGELTFTGEFADEPADRVGGWIQSDLAAHLSVFDA